MASTRRQKIYEMLKFEEWSIDDLRHEVGITVKILEEDLHHIERSARAIGAVLHMRAAICRGCGFKFTRGALHPPGRCPKCRESHIDGPWVKITA